jgi:hypothetical protein
MDVRERSKKKDEVFFLENQYDKLGVIHTKTSHFLPFPPISSHFLLLLLLPTFADNIETLTHITVNG